MIKPQNIDIDRIDKSIQLIEKYVEDSNVNPLIAELSALQLDPHNEALLAQLSNTFNNIGVLQGAVLTYAPYLSVLLSDDLFAND